MYIYMYIYVYLSEAGSGAFALAQAAPHQRHLILQPTDQAVLFACIHVYVGVLCLFCCFLFLFFS
jgi:hypothetical protein